MAPHQAVETRQISLSQPLGVLVIRVQCVASILNTAEGLLGTHPGARKGGRPSPRL